jgi:hypothetical protein
MRAFLTSKPERGIEEPGKGVSLRQRSRWEIEPGVLEENGRVEEWDWVLYWGGV